MGGWKEICCLLPKDPLFHPSINRTLLLWANQKREEISSLKGQTLLKSFTAGKRQIEKEPHISSEFQETVISTFFPSLPSQFSACFPLWLWSCKRSYLFHLLANGSVAVTIIDCKVWCRVFFLVCVVLYGFRCYRLAAHRIIRHPQSELKNYQRIILYHCKLSAISYHPIIHSRRPLYIGSAFPRSYSFAFLLFQMHFHAREGPHGNWIISLHCKTKLISFYFIINSLYLNQGQGWRNAPAHRSYY